MGGQKRSRAIALALIVFPVLLAPASGQYTQQGAKLVGTDTQGMTQQGRGVAISADGNTAIIGAPNSHAGSGGLWAFTRNSNGEWSQQGSRLLGTGAEGAAAQGFSVAISADGNTALVGGRADNGQRGAAWVFTRTGGTWNQQGNKLVGTSAVGAAEQGYSVALSADGNVAAVGGWKDDGGAGAVWVFTRTNGVWTQLGFKLVGASASGKAAQGSAVALSGTGTTLLVGGYSDNTEVGAAWVFTRTASVWTQQGSKLSQGTSWQGFSVALSSDGDTALVGAPHDSSRKGTAIVYRRTNGVWTSTASLSGSDTAGATVDQGFGVGLSPDGQTAIVGGPQDGGGLGAAWVFAYDSQGQRWVQVGNKLAGSGAVRAPNANSSEVLRGASVAVSADHGTLIVGGPFDNNQTGAAWVFTVPQCAAVSVKANEMYVRATGTFFPGIPVDVVANGEVSLTRDDQYSTDAAGIITKAPTTGTSAYSFFLNSADPTGTAPELGISKRIVGGEMRGLTYGALIAAWSPASSDVPTTEWSQVGRSGFVSAPDQAALRAGARLYLAVADPIRGDDSGEYSVTVNWPGCRTTPVLIAPEPVVFRYQVGGAAPSEVQIQIASRPTGVRFTADRTDPGFTVIPPGGVTPVAIRVSASTAGVTTPRTYRSEIRITPTTEGVAPIMVPVSLVVTDSTAISISCTASTGPQALDTNYTTTCTASGGKSPYTWAIDGSMPTGLGSRTDGEGPAFTISGTPTTAVTYSYEVKVTDSSNPKREGRLKFSGTLGAKPGAALFTAEGNKIISPDGGSIQANSVAISRDGNTVIAGASSENAARVFVRNNGVWTQQGSRLIGSGALGNARQGTTVAIAADGNTIVIGGPTDNNNMGAIWVFTRMGGVWSQQGNKLIGTGAVGGTPLQGMKVAVSADGNTIIEGGPLDDTNKGAAWIFTRNNGVWTQQGSKLTGSGATTEAWFGASVSISSDGNTAIASATKDNDSRGALWVFTRNNGTWTQQGNKLVGSDGSGQQQQGFSTALSDDGNTAIVGALSDNSETGAAWVFTRRNGVWTQQGNKLVGIGAAGAAKQGNSVAISADGNTAVIGGPQDTNALGAVWVFTRSGDNWTQEGAKLVGVGSVANAQQGYASAISGDGNTIVVGAAGGTAANQSGFWVFVRNSPPTPKITPQITGVRSALGFGGYNALVTPVTYIEILGTNLSSFKRSWEGSDFVTDASGAQRAPTQLADSANVQNTVQVKIGGQSAYMYYVSPTQINVLVPALPSGPSQVTVINQDGTSNAFQVTVRDVLPGFLAEDAMVLNGRRYVRAYNQADSLAVPVSALSAEYQRAFPSSAPACLGSTIVLYGLGFGSVLPNIPDGVVPTQPTALTRQLRITFTSGGISSSATLSNLQGQYAGFVQGNLGLYQFNVRVPDDAPTGDAVGVTFTLGGQAPAADSTQTLNIALRRCQ